MSEITNPYRPGEPVTQPDLLFGRQEAADWVELQLNNQARIIILSAHPLIGKTSFIKHIAVLQNIEAYNLRVTLAPFNRYPSLSTPPHQETDPPSSVEEVLEAVMEQLLPQLTSLNLLSSIHSVSNKTNAAALRELFAKIDTQDTLLNLYIDDLHALVAEDKTLVATFLSTFMPILDESPPLHLIFVANQDKLKQITHPLLDGAPTFNLTTLTPDASVNMVTIPVKNILRFDYGVTRRIAEINSHHPYYLTLFCHTLLNRQMHDGWVNQRDFDSALAEILASYIEPFTRIWEQSSWVERAVLTGMAAMQGKHGPMTQQEVIRFLQREDKAAHPVVIIEALKTLAERGVLVPMGAVSYRFHVELLRFWLREHTELAEILKEVDWARLSALAKRPKVEKASTPPIASRPKKRSTILPSKNRLVWTLVISLLVGGCFLTTGAAMAVQFWDIPIAFLSTPTPTLTPTVQKNEPESAGASSEVVPTETVAPTPTVTPTPALVVARTLPSITYMGRDIDESWRIYVMNADGSEIQVISEEGQDSTGSTWSPSGSKIAFVSLLDGNREIYVMDSTGQNMVNITRHPADDWTPSWSPDGTQLAFASLRDGNWEIFIMDVSCLNAPETCPEHITQITADGNANISPVWSPDGTRLAFTSKAAGNWDVYTMNVDGSNIRQITTHEANDLAPSWSPDGTQLAFESGRDGNVEIYVIPATGGTPRNITNLSLANDHGPTWSPDGQQIVFYSNREGNWDIISTSLDGEQVINLTDTPSRDEQTPAWRP